MNNQNVLDLIAHYETEFKGDDAYVSPLLKSQLGNGEDLFSRKNFTGHITASALVLNEAGDEILLINHKFLQMWLQPGGHVEGEGALHIEAMREVEEETGVSVKLHPWHLAKANLDMPFTIDSHDIPPAPKKNEDAHVHHDFTYLFLADQTDSITLQEEEVDGAKWFKLNDIHNIKTDIHKFVKRIQKFL